MECYCKHHLTEFNNDESFLLDDKNTLPLLSDFETASNIQPYCVRCNIIKPEKEMSTDEPKWKSVEEAITILDTFPTVVGSSRRVSNSTDSLDSPLLVNDIYSDVLIGGNQDLGAGHFHCHTISNPKQSNTAWRQITAAAFMCFIFMIAELIGGYFASSLAVMTDAAHLLSDFIGFLVSLFAIWMGQRPPTKSMPFGYYRAEVLGALFSIAVIWILTGVFIYLAVLRVVHPDFEIKADTMMAVSGFGVVINILTGLILHGVCQDISHSHSHSVGSAHSHNHKNINLRAAIIHVLGDLIQSVGVFVAAIVIKNYPNAKIADPLCTFFFSILIIFTTKSILRDSINILMEGFPLHISYNLVYTALKSIAGIRNVHNLHVWSLTTNRYALGVHLVVDESLDKNDILRRATKLIKHKFEIHSITIQVETYSDQAHQCLECQLPPD